MQDYILTCCSATDLNKDFFEKNNVPCLGFPFRIAGRDYCDDFGETLPVKEFYNMIRQGEMPTTSQLNMTEFEDFFRPFLESGLDILHISFSSGLSGTFQNAHNAAEELKEEFPDRRILVVDSLAASAGYGLLMDTLASLKNSGYTLDELFEFAENNKLNLHHWFYTTDLTHLKRGGRISSASAFVGNLLNICPLMNVDFEGHLIPRDKLRGKKKAACETLSKMKEHCKDGTSYDQKCFISHSDCLEDAEYLARLIEAEFPNLTGKIQIYDIGSLIGSHTGPGTVALFFWGDTRTD